MRSFKLRGQPFLPRPLLALSDLNLQEFSSPSHSLPTFFDFDKIGMPGPVISSCYLSQQFLVLHITLNCGHAYTCDRFK